eukprot:CAMPEP_0198212206 /NCGR_PEP_ID=MMETSP1445-20131203/25583_1 /TAXON_ID=36898 /ORGANISM="Pyramimonas sp., Strain CCMP2087" /LENGTH=140 /DNA_ID=CAMNT_0043886603 /DNA_START=24 /DNA_END=446 /DNA_ORIENTATION=+
MASARDEFRAIRAVISNAMAERKRESLTVERAYMERLAKDARQENQNPNTVLLPDQVPVAILLARQLHKKGRTAEALAVLQKIVTNVPSCEEARRELRKLIDITNRTSADQSACEATKRTSTRDGPPRVSSTNVKRKQQM